MCGGGFLAVCCLGRVGLGRQGVLALAEGWVTVLSCTVVWGGWLPGAWCRKHARCCLLGGGGCPRVPLVRGGGMLSGFWGSAPWLPDPCSAALFVGGGVWVWVGWL